MDWRSVLKSSSQGRKSTKNIQKSIIKSRVDLLQTCFWGLCWVWWLDNIGHRVSWNDARWHLWFGKCRLDVRAMCFFHSRANTVSHGTGYRIHHKHLFDKRTPFEATFSTGRVRLSSFLSQQYRDAGDSCTTLFEEISYRTRQWRTARKIWLATMKHQPTRHGSSYKHSWIVSWTLPRIRLPTWIRHW